jgi:hypothetical protein
MTPRDIPGYEGYYQVTDDGYVISVTRSVRPNTPPFKMKTFTTSDGYLRVTLSREGKYRKFLVHRIVASAWLPPAPSEAHEINHIDSVKSNNHRNNLEWSTRSENMQHAKRLGLRPLQVGDKGSYTRIMSTQIRDLVAMLKTGCGTAKAAEAFGVHRDTITNTLKRFGIGWGRKGFTGSHK